LKDKKADKDAERQQQKEELRATSGSSARDVELGLLSSRLAKDGFKIKEVAADGHCLYRAVNDQLRQLQQGVLSEDSEAQLASLRASLLGPDSDAAVACLRGAVANHIRAHSGDFAPFLGIDIADGRAAIEGEDGWAVLDAYCNTVASMELAEWGGQLELKAMAALLNRQIRVYSADAPVLCMGDASGQGAAAASALVLAYHRHFYALGEHYNSTVKF